MVVFCSVVVTMLVVCIFETLGKQYLTPYHNLEYVQIAIVMFASGLGVVGSCFRILALHVAIWMTRVRVTRIPFSVIYHHRSLFRH